MALLFFKIFAFKIALLLHMLEPIFKAFFPFWDLILETSVQNASTAVSGDTNRSPHILCLMFGNKKKSLGDKSGEYGQWVINTIFLLNKKSTVWHAEWQLALSWWRMMWRLRFILRYSLMTSSKQIVTYQSTFTVLRSSKATCPV